jgi:carboxypeptidase PM20D1
MRFIGYAILIGTLLLVVVLLVRTFTFGERARAVAVERAPAIPIDAARVAGNLSRVLQFETVVYQDSSEFDATPFRDLHAYLEATFPSVYAELDVETVNGLSLLYKWQGTEPGLEPILLMAHQDVVPAVDAAAWSYPPFSGASADGFVWGRGALDVKSSVVGILEAVDYLLKQDYRPQRTIYVAFGHDEEVGGHGGAAQIAELLRSRGVHFDYVLDEGGAVVDGVVPDVAVPVAMVGIAEKGYVTLELSIEREGGHSSMPPPHTAVGELSSAIVELERTPFPPQTEFAERLFYYIAPHLPFPRRMIVSNLWAFKPVVVRLLRANRETNALIRTTTAATIFEELPHPARRECGSGGRLRPQHDQEPEHPYTPYRGRLRPVTVGRRDVGELPGAEPHDTGVFRSGSDRRPLSYSRCHGFTLPHITSRQRVPVLFHACVPR